MSPKVVRIAAILSLFLSLGESNAPPMNGLHLEEEMPDPGDVPALVAWTYLQGPDSIVFCWSFGLYYITLALA